MEMWRTYPVRIYPSPAARHLLDGQSFGVSQTGTRALNLALGNAPCGPIEEDTNATLKTPNYMHNG
jgi:hypothetical protein